MKCCEGSVSYPATTYYAHLAAYTAREHHNALITSTENGVKKEDRKIGKQYINEPLCMGSK